MKKNLVAFFGISCALLAPVDCMGLGIQVGPFDLVLPIHTRAEKMTAVNDPICHAIAQKKLLEMVLEWDERIDKNQTKVTIKKVTIEPYLFGKTADGQLVLRGNIISEKLLKEVSIKFGDFDDADSDKPSEISTNTENSEKIPTDGVHTISIYNVTEVRVIAGSTFDPPKDYNKVFKNDVAEVICTVSSVTK